MKYIKIWNCFLHGDTLNSIIEKYPNTFTRSRVNCFTACNNKKEAEEKVKACSKYFACYVDRGFYLQENTKRITDDIRLKTLLEDGKMVIQPIENNFSLTIEEVSKCLDSFLKNKEKLDDNNKYEDINSRGKILVPLQ